MQCKAHFRRPDLADVQYPFPSLLFPQTLHLLIKFFIFCQLNHATLVGYAVNRGVRKEITVLHPRKEGLAGRQTLLCPGRGGRSRGRETGFGRLTLCSLGNQADGKCQGLAPETQLAVKTGLSANGIMMD